MATEAQINANRENSKFSHGPVTAEGKETCSKNALKHALTGCTVLLPTDDLAAYETLCAILDKKFAPETDAEKLLVESISETEWRLQRINVIHSGIFALGRLEHKNDFADEVELAWKVIDPIHEAWKATGLPAVLQYEAGGWGPRQSDDWMAAQGRQWFDYCPVLHLSLIHI